MYYLKNYKTKDLSDKILQGFDEDMQILRNHGFKCVLRFAYDWSGKNDASLQWVQRHAGQLKPYLAKNVGFAPLYNERPAYIVLHKGNQSYSARLISDPRRWLPNDVVTTVSEMITIPDEVPEGTYELYLHLPDVYASLANDPRYAVRFANKDTWDAETGMNRLNVQITISKGGQGLDQITNHQSPITNKIIKDNQLFILRGEQVYTIQGQKVQ